MEDFSMAELQDAGLQRFNSSDELSHIIQFLLGGSYLLFRRNCD
jgi:hypothetical protein